MTGCQLFPANIGNAPCRKHDDARKFLDVRGYVFPLSTDKVQGYGTDRAENGYSQRHSAQRVQSLAGRWRKRERPCARCIRPQQTLERHQHAAPKHQRDHRQECTPSRRRRNSREHLGGEHRRGQQREDQHPAVERPAVRFSGASHTGFLTSARLQSAASALRRAVSLNRQPGSRSSSALRTESRDPCP